MNIIPARIASRDLCLGYFVSDLYFSDVVKPDDDDYCWNINNNGDFTDDDEHLDLEADLLVGRAPVNSPEQAVNFIDKIKHYEQNTFPNQYKNISLIGAYITTCGFTGQNSCLGMVESCDYRRYNTE